jgi:hypothetical protein
MPGGELPGINSQNGSNPIAGMRMAMRLYGSRKDRRKGTPTTEDQAHFENLAELARHHSQLRMNEEANKANIRDKELERSTTHLENRIRAARGASQIEINGHVMGEVLVDDKALGLRLGGYKRGDMPAGAESSEGAAAPARRAPEHEGTEVPFTKASVHANDKQAEQNRIDASYGLGEKSITDIGHEAGASGRLQEWVDAKYGAGE